MKWVLLLVGMGLAGCTTVQNDRSTNNVRQFYDTAVHTLPVNRSERDQLQKMADEKLAAKVTPLEAKVAELALARHYAYTNYKKEFPDCSTQKHCLNNLTSGDIKRFERFKELTAEVVKYDQPIIEAKTEIENAKRRHSVFVRWVYNRFLAHELLSLRDERGAGVVDVKLHSLESLPTKRDFSRRLFQFSDSDIMEGHLWDLDFRMHGIPVDEAALLVALDVTLAPYRKPVDGDSRKFLVTFLVNTHQLDQHYYDMPFKRAILNLFMEPGRMQLKNKVFCAFYSIAGDTLQPRLQPSKLKECPEASRRMRSPLVSGLEAVEEAVLPLAYYEKTP